MARKKRSGGAEIGIGSFEQEQFDSRREGADMPRPSGPGDTGKGSAADKAAAVETGEATAEEVNGGSEDDSKDDGEKPLGLLARVKAAFSRKPKTVSNGANGANGAQATTQAASRGGRSNGMIGDNAKQPSAKGAKAGGAKSAKGAAKATKATKATKAKASGKATKRKQTQGTKAGDTRKESRTAGKSAPEAGKQGRGNKPKQKATDAKRGGMPASRIDKSNGKRR